MKSLQHVAVFGATGMVGQGVLRCVLADPGIRQVTAIGRSKSPIVDAKLQQIHRADLTQQTGLEPVFAQLDAVFFCLGVSAMGLGEAAYRAITCDTALSAARALHAANPDARFIYVSAKGADGTMQSRTMWARLRGQLEHDLQAISADYYMVRPGIIAPMDGIASRTFSYRVLYGVLRPLMPWLQRRWPKLVTTTQQLARVMVYLARAGHPAPVIESRDFADIDAQALRTRPAG